ncbi:hypothetical protein B0H16DRAFT_1745406 [Mycena metata]|uniref:Uncharacterized protein n=1 Tax=Mycena metata TaxID=1033252 RepID=A0AAD7H329_9AGAR|nr:hypothetical protein B0H16DRAFT_1745406 [Mycena metata]
MPLKLPPLAVPDPSSPTCPTEGCNCKHPQGPLPFRQTTPGHAALGLPSNPLAFPEPATDPALVLQAEALINQAQCPSFTPAPVFSSLGTLDETHPKSLHMLSLLGSARFDDRVTMKLDYILGFRTVTQSKFKREPTIHGLLFMASTHFAKIPAAPLVLALLSRPIDIYPLAAQPPFYTPAGLAQIV